MLDHNKEMTKVLRNYAIPAIISGSERFRSLEHAAADWGVTPARLQRLMNKEFPGFVMIPSSNCSCGDCKHSAAAIPAVLNGTMTVGQAALQWNIDLGILRQLVAEAKSKMPSNPVRTAEAQQQIDTVHVERKATRSIVEAVNDLALRKEKFRIRRSLLDLIKAELLPATVSALTMPGSAWILERDILSVSPCGSVVGLEEQKDVIENAELNVPDFTGRCSFIHTTDKAYFSVGRGVEFNFIWLDYMGAFSENRLHVYEDMLKNGFVQDHTLVALTFQKGRESGATKDVYKKFGKPKASGSGKLTHLRKLAIPNEYCKISSKYGYEFTVLNMEEYQEQIPGKQHTSPMFILVFRLQKKNSSMNGSRAKGEVFPVKQPAFTENTRGKCKLAIVTDRDLIIFRILSNGPTAFSQIKSSIENVQHKKVPERVLRVRLAKLKNAGFIESERCSSRNQIVTLYSLTDTSVSMLTGNSYPRAAAAICTLSKTSLLETATRKRSLIGAAVCAASCAA
ncbi:MAG: hypothetical protein ACLQF0_05680 [Dissulfurispiraceae bacterium]